MMMMMMWKYEMISQNYCLMFRIQSLSMFLGAILMAMRGYDAGRPRHTGDELTI
jgi:hypothetical protein